MTSLRFIRSWGQLPAISQMYQEMVSVSLSIAILGSPGCSTVPRGHPMILWVAAHAVLQYPEVRSAAGEGSSWEGVPARQLQGNHHSRHAHDGCCSSCPASHREHRRGHCRNLPWGRLFCRRPPGPRPTISAGACTSDRWQACISNRQTCTSERRSARKSDRRSD